MILLFPWLRGRRRRVPHVCAATANLLVRVALPLPVVLTVVRGIRLHRAHGLGLFAVLHGYTHSVRRYGDLFRSTQPLTAQHGDEPWRNSCPASRCLCG